MYENVSYSGNEINQMKYVFISLVVVKPIEGNTDLGNSVGAAVNVLYLCDSKGKYVDEVPKRLLEYGFETIEIDEVEIFDPQNSENVGDLIAKSELLTINDPIQWGTFYSFDSWEDET